MNPWLKIPLEDYEGHMSLNSIAQAQYISQLLYENTKEVDARSLAIIGCSGGNGLDKLKKTNVKRVIGVDINPFYLDTAYQRYKYKFDILDFICMDFVNPAFVFQSVDLIYAALVFEYVDYKAGIISLNKFIKKNGFLSAVLQLSNERMSEICPSPYTSIDLLKNIFKFVCIEEFMDAAKKCGLTIIKTQKVTLSSGKQFQEILFQKK